MDARKIALTPAASYLVAMPASYVPTRVTAEDLARDAALCSARAELAPTHAATLAQWDMAVDTSEIDGGSEDMADTARQARNAWDDALDACDRGDLDGAREALNGARQLASQGGDDAEERKALAMFEGES